MAATSFLPPYIGQCLTCGHLVSARTARSVYEALVDHIPALHPSPIVPAADRAVPHSGSDSPTENR